MCFFNGFVSGDKPDEGIKITAVNPVIEHGVVTWNDGAIDCAPEYMYDHSFEYAKDEPYKRYHDLLKEKRNAEYLAKLDRSYNQLASGDVVVKPMDELQRMADE